MKNLIRKLAAFLDIKTDASLFDINQDEIQKANLLFMRQISLTGAFLTLLLCAASFFIPSLSQQTMPYFMMFVVSSIIFGLTCIAFNILLNYTYPLSYFYVTLLMAFSAALSIYYKPEGTATIFVVLLALLPLLILDKQSHVVPYTIIIWILFCIGSFSVKELKYAQYDVINSTAALVIGIMVNARISKSRISNLNSSRILARQVEIDGLTGLPNYKKLIQDLSGENDSRIAKSICSLAVIDIDNFMEYNTKYGRESGDKALKKIGSCMQRISDPSELIVYRYGGTRFVAVSLIHDYKGIQRVCQGISSLIRGLEIEFHGAVENKITVSCGYVDVVECESDDYSSMLSMAREALEQALKEGGNTSIGYLQLKKLQYT